MSLLHWAKDSASEFQLRDVRNILSSYKDLDMEYLNQWIERLGLKTIYDKVK
jgi:hypothetical protein